MTKAKLLRLLDAQEKLIVAQRGLIAALKARLANHSCVLRRDFHAEG